MNKKFLKIFILGLVIFLSIWAYKGIYKRPYFIPVAIEGYTYGHLPYVQVNIEGWEYCLVLDLGYAGEATLAYGGLAEIRGKVFEKTVITGGFLGTKYKQNIYRIPELKIHRMKFDSVLLEEESTELHIDSALDQATVDLPEFTAGALGSLLFRNTCLCIDLYSSMMAFSDSFETVKRELKPVHPFVAVPFQFINGWIEFDLETSEGKLHCMLDTGSTRNHIDSPNVENIPIKDFSKNEKQLQIVQIGNRDFGPITFSPIPLKYPTKIDAILGVEFLLEHIVVIDFIKHELYIRRTVYQD